ncbi:transcriptional regulator [Dehalococcoidia bacterium]|nr:transcriptional regulator [Dehalococcoidia bacterium]
MVRHRGESDGPIWDRVNGFNRLLEHRTKLGICVLLARNDTITFSRLKALLNETDGALGAHLRKLEDEDYLVVKKEFRDRKPTSWYSLTQDGRKALETHLQALEKLIAEAGD